MIQSARSGFDLSNFIRRAVTLLFSVIQTVLVGRIFVDLGIVPEDVTFGRYVVIWSDVLAAPVQGLGSGLDSIFGGGGFTAIAGDGFDPAIVAAMIGWAVLQRVVMRVVRTYDEI